MRLSKCALVLSLLWLFNMLHSVIVEGVKCLICSDASAGRLISENKCHVERSGLLRCQHKEIKRRNARRRCSNSFCSAILEFSSHPWILSCGFFKGGPDYVWASQLSRIFFFSPHPEESTDLVLWKGFRSGIIQYNRLQKQHLFSYQWDQLWLGNNTTITPPPHTWHKISANKWLHKQ